MAVTTAQYQAALKLTRKRTALAVARLWQALTSHREGDVAPFVRRVVPIVTAGQQRAAAVSNAYLGGQLGTGPAAVDVGRVLAGIRGDTTLAEVYRRPFVSVWTALSNGTPYTQAIEVGLERLTSTAETDVALSARAVVSEIVQSVPRITGYMRVPDAGACDLCLLAATQRYSTDQLMPIHNRCGCTVRPITGRFTAGGDLFGVFDSAGEFLDNRRVYGDEGAATARATELGNATARPISPNEARALAQATVAVHEHGELGPVLGRAGDDFTQL